MYSEANILSLSSQVKWRKSNESDFATLLDDDVLATSSIEKVYQEAHEIVTIRNIHSCQPNAEISTQKFKTYIEQMSVDCVKKVLTDIFDMNIRATRGVNYDGLIECNYTVFYDSMLWYMAIQVAQLMLHTTRANRDERTLKYSKSSLMMILEGVKNENGSTVSVGLEYRYQQSIERAIDILFPDDGFGVIHNVEQW